jgi:hypothetical protein
MKDIIKGIWNDKFSRYLFIVLFVAGVFLLISPGEEQTNGDELAVHFFYHPNCPHCHEQKDFHKTLIERFPDIRIVEYDVSSPENSARLMEFAQKAGVSGLGVPATFFGDYHFVGFRSADTSGRDIENALEKFLAGESGEFEAPGSPRLIALPLFGEIDPLGFSLPVLAVVLGLVDGFNPCAMWVLVYLISLAMTMKSRRRMWLIIGTFVLASGILYFLFMTAWLNAFLFMGYVRPITIIIGLSALGFGISNLKTFFTTKGALACDVGDINSKKSTMERMKKVVHSPLTISTFFGIVALAFVVNSVEFVCSSAIPAVFTQVLALSSLSGLEYYGYILLYVLMFMLDDLIIFSLAIFAVNSSIGDKYAKYCKLIGGMILVALGVLLTFMPHLLR